MIGNLLNRSVEVYREQRSPDGAGGSVASWEHVATVRARVSQPTAAERVAAQQAGSELSARVYLDAHTDVRRGDEVRTPSGTEVYRVVSLARPSIAAYLAADCERVQRRAEEWPVENTSRYEG